MEEFGEAKFDWLKDRLGLSLSHGVPSHDTFARLFARLDPEAFAACFGRWAQTIQEHTQGRVIALDGKTSRRSFDSASGKAALHTVSAWCGHNRLVLGQMAVEAKTNEIKAIPALLELLDINQCVVTVDALNCQKEIAKQILRQGGDYLFALKSNHAHLHEDVVGHFDWSLKQLAKSRDCQLIFDSIAESRNYGHGRKETRRCWCLNAATEEWEQARAQWFGLGSLVMVESERSVSMSTPDGGTAWSEPTYERRYYLSSLAPNPDGQLAGRALEAAREHWGIENSLHWVLDVVFNEDQSRIRKDNAPINMTMLRHLTINLLRLEKTHKRGLKSKRLRAGWDDEYRLKLMVGGKS
jgi:predicted transposase YbfD/YdcC